MRGLVGADRSAPGRDEDCRSRGARKSAGGVGDDCRVDLEARTIMKLTVPGGGFFGILEA
jgi:hypothetical protein